MDWGTVIVRRENNQPVDKGGWSAVCTTANGLGHADPNAAFPARHGREAPGSAGPTAPGSRNCAPPGSMRRTWRHKSRSPPTFSVNAGSTFRICRLASGISRWPGRTRSTAFLTGSRCSGVCDGFRRTAAHRRNLLFCRARTGAMTPHETPPLYHRAAAMRSPPITSFGSHPKMRIEPCAPGHRC